jgi:hypothetical protein
MAKPILNSGDIVTTVYAYFLVKPSYEQICAHEKYFLKSPVSKQATDDNNDNVIQSDSALRINKSI